MKISIALDCGAAAVVEECLRNYAAAVAAKDAAALIRLYDPGVRVFDAWERWSCEGAAAWGVAVRAWFDSLGAAGVRVPFAGTNSSAGTDMILVGIFVTYADILPQGAALRSMQNRMTWGLRVSDAGPRIIHEHTSLPIAFDGMKAIFNR